MTARLRHQLVRHRDGTIDLVVTPHDGRYPESYRVLPAELRRFAWAVLADLDPDEAAATAAEAGGDLVELCAGDVAGLRRLRAIDGSRPICTRPPPPTSKKFRILQLLSEGRHTIQAVRARMPDAARPDALLFELAEDGFACRVSGSGPGHHEWDLTKAGLALVTPVGRRAAG